jgi:hypothetical protein
MIIARQQLGKHITGVMLSTIKGHLLLVNGSVNRLCQQYRFCFLWGPCRVVIRGSSSEAGVQFRSTRSTITEYSRISRRTGKRTESDLLICEVGGLVIAP